MQRDFRATRFQCEKDFQTPGPVLLQLYTLKGAMLYLNDMCGAVGRISRCLKTEQKSEQLENRNSGQLDTTSPAHGIRHTQSADAGISWTGVQKLV